MFKRKFKPYLQLEKEIRKEEQMRAELMEERFESLPDAVKMIPTAAKEALRCTLGPAGGGYRH